MDSDGASLHILGLTGISQRARTVFRTEERVFTPRDLGILSNEDLREAIAPLSTSPTVTRPLHVVVSSVLHRRRR